MGMDVDAEGKGVVYFEDVMYFEEKDVLSFEEGDYFEEVMVPINGF